MPRKIINTTDFAGGNDGAISKLNSNFAELYTNGGGSGSGGSSNILNAKDYGAVGDWNSDDTEALEQLFDDAASTHAAIYIPAGTYKIRRPLPLKSGMEIFGDGEATIIKKVPAVWTTTTSAISENDRKIYVNSTNGFAVNDHIFISNSSLVTTNPQQTSARNCSYGVVESIGEETVSNTTKKYIVFKSAYERLDSNNNPIKVGAVKAYNQGVYVSRSFPIFRSWGMYDECVGVYIHDICLDGNRQNGEPMEWTNACVHFDAYQATIHSTSGITYDKHSYNHIIERCKLINSSFDAISDQAEGNLNVNCCVIENPRMHGIHCGTTFSNATICGNTMDGDSSSNYKTLGAGVFFCQNVTKLIVSSNHISKFNKGVSDQEYGSVGKNSVIVGNIFTNIQSHVFDFSFAFSSASRGGGLVICNNYIEGLKGSLFFGDYLDNVVISNNMVNSITTKPTNLIAITQSDNVIINGNMHPSNTTFDVAVLSTDTTNIKVINNSWQ